jgi:hypothetical protein
MKKTLMFAMIGFFILDLAPVRSGGCNKSASTSNKDSGKVAGTVTFSGLPCQPGQPDFNVPPCTGPYPNYKIDVYESADEKNLKITAMTDARGNFSIELPKGSYVIFTQNGPMEKNVQKNTFTIGNGTESHLDLRISTGIQ